MDVKKKPQAGKAAAGVLLALFLGLGVLILLQWNGKRVDSEALVVETPRAVQQPSVSVGIHESESALSDAGLRRVPAGEPGREAPSEQLPALTVDYLRIGEALRPGGRATLYSALDSDWVQTDLTESVDLEQEQVSAWGPDGLVVVRVNGGPMYLQQGSLSWEQLEAMAPQEGSALRVSFRPALTEGLIGRCSVYVQPDDDRGMQLGSEGLVSHGPLSVGGGVTMERVYTVEEAASIRAVHPGVEYRIDAEFSPSSQAGPITAQSVVVEGAGVGEIAWSEAKAIQFILDPPSKLNGTLFAREAGGLRAIPRGEFLDGVAFLEPRYIRAGSYSFSGAGPGWATRLPQVQLEIGSGAMEEGRVYLTWANTSSSSIEFKGGAGQLEGAAVYYDFGGGDLGAYPIEVGDPRVGFHRWEGSRLVLTGLQTPVSVVAWFPQLGVRSRVELSPEQDRTVTLEGFPVRPFEAARSIAREWASKEQPLVGYCTVERNIAEPGGEPWWIHVLFVDTRLSDAFDEGVWDVAHDSEAEFRIQITPQGEPAVVRALP